MTPRRPRSPFVLALLVAAGGAAAPAGAQSAEYTLDESGSWRQSAAPNLNPDAAAIAQARRHLAEENPAPAYALLDDWIKAHERTDNPYLPEAYLLRGDALTAQGHEFHALYDYEAVIKNFPGSDAYVKAIERELDIAVRYVNGLRRKFLGMRVFDADDLGEELLIRVQERLPGSRLAERAGIELADFYYRNRKMELAVEAYGLFLENYPRSPYAPKAMQRRIYATIAQFKGPRYNGAPLRDAGVLVRRFAALYPSQAAAAGLDEALLARMDESAAAELLETARWHLRVNDPVSARYILLRLVARHPKTASASTALQILADRGWIDLAPPALLIPSTPPASSPTDPSDARSAPGYPWMDGRPVTPPSSRPAAPEHPEMRP